MPGIVRLVLAFGCFRVPTEGANLNPVANIRGLIDSGAKRRTQGDGNV